MKNCLVSVEDVTAWLSVEEVTAWPSKYVAGLLDLFQEFGLEVMKGGLDDNNRPWCYFGSGIYADFVEGGMILYGSQRGSSVLRELCWPVDRGEFNGLASDLKFEFLLGSVPQGESELSLCSETLKKIRRMTT